MSRIRCMHVPHHLTTISYYRYVLEKYKGESTKETCAQQGTGGIKIEIQVRIKRLSVSGRKSKGEGNKDTMVCRIPER